MENMQDKTIKELARSCQTVEDVQNLLKSLFKDTLQTIFEAELETHLGYEKHSARATIPATAVTATARKPSNQNSAKRS